jgi:hypothetical protein
MPHSIISYKDTTFTSNFWTGIFKAQGVFLAFSDNLSPLVRWLVEAVNKYVENYLRCMICDKPSEWVQWLLPFIILPE